MRPVSARSSTGRHSSTISTPSLRMRSPGNASSLSCAPLRRRAVKAETPYRLSGHLGPLYPDGGAGLSARCVALRAITRCVARSAQFAGANLVDDLPHITLSVRLSRFTDHNGGTACVHHGALTGSG